MAKKEQVKTDKKIGDKINWVDMNGLSRQGKIIEIKGNLATVEMKDGHKTKVEV
jgi:hypothetical protein